MRLKGAHSIVWMTDGGHAEDSRADAAKHCEAMGIAYSDLYIPKGYTYINPDGEEEIVKDAGALSLEVIEPLVMAAVQNILNPV